MDYRDQNATIERHVQLLERHAFEIITAVAREQEAFAPDGDDFFALDWIAIRDSIPTIRRRTRYLLRTAGIKNLEAEVLDLVNDGCSSSRDVYARLFENYGDVVDVKQVHRALHKLVARAAVLRTARNTYKPLQEATM